MKRLAILVMMMSSFSVVAAYAATMTAVCGPAETVIASKEAWGAINPDIYSQMQLAAENSDKEGMAAMARQGVIWRIPMRSISCVKMRAHANYRVQVTVAPDPTFILVPVPVWVDDRVFTTVD